MKGCECCRQMITGQEYAALQYYIHRLEACIRKDVSSGVTHWLGRIHELEAKIDRRGENVEAEL